MGGATFDGDGATLRAVRFQSTLPVGGATKLISVFIHFFEKISIHAPRGGSDIHLTAIQAVYSSFQSTLPVGGATVL